MAGPRCRRGARGCCHRLGLVRGQHAGSAMGSRGQPRARRFYQRQGCGQPGGAGPFLTARGGTSVRCPWTWAYPAPRIHSAENSLNRSRPESVHRVYRSLSAVRDGEGATVESQERDPGRPWQVQSVPPSLSPTRQCRHRTAGQPVSGGRNVLRLRHALRQRIPGAGDEGRRVRRTSEKTSPARRPRTSAFSPGQARDARRAGSSPSCARSGRVFAAVGVGTDCPTSQRLGPGGPGAGPGSRPK